MEESFQKKDLVVLDYTSGGRGVNVVNAKEAEDGIKKLSINSENCAWTFDGKTYAIGIMRNCELSHRSGVIGVYDRTKTSHLWLMIFHAQKAIE